MGPLWRTGQACKTGPPWTAGSSVDPELALEVAAVDVAPNVSSHHPLAVHLNVGVGAGVSPL